MKFRTELKIRPLPVRIDYRDPILVFGSCFADEMRERLRRLKFRVSGNFTGPLFNPASIAAQLRRTQDTRPATEAELHRGIDGRWFHYDTNTLVSGPDPDEVLGRCNAALDAVGRGLAEAEHVVVTFGTAWVYRLRETGRIVANCHKQPASLFNRQRLTVAEIVAEWSDLLSGPLHGKQIILTVSPIRHLGDGLDGNCLSKSTLRVAAAELEERFDHVHYFPAYELLLDDLRDYRFYADDLVHPSRQAVEYIWEQFSEAALTERTRSILPEVERLVSLAAHRPQNPEGEEFKLLCERTLARMDELQRRENLDFSDEIACLNAKKSR